MQIVTRMKYIIPIIFLFFSTNIRAQKPDTLYISFSKDLINKSVFINQIDVFGDSIRNIKSERISFLFTNPDLMLKLKQKIETDSIATEEREKNKNFINYRGYSSGPPQFGIELNYYQRDSLGVNNYNRTKKYYLKSIGDMRKAGATEAQIRAYKKDLFRTLSPPLRQIFVQHSYLENKEVFDYVGTVKSYKALKNYLDTFAKFFVILPYNASELYNYDYHLLGVQKRYIVPGM